jgi:hypothetical protein
MANTLTDDQRETLRLALDDAVLYRDPPLECARCPNDEANELCDECSAAMTRTTSYRELSETLGLQSRT